MVEAGRRDVEEGIGGVGGRIGDFVIDEDGKAVFKEAALGMTEKDVGRKPA